MGLTVTNTNTLTLLQILNRNSVNQKTTLQQLTTGKRINTGKDDPAGLIALSKLNSELSAVGTALNNNTRTDSMLTVADSAIGEISNLLGEIETLVSSTASEANLTSAEVAANQAQIDDALAAIDRIVQTTNFNGQKLLDGAFSIQHTGFSGNQNLSNLRIYSRSQSNTDTSLTINRVASAQLAQIAMQGGTTVGGGGLTTSGNSELAVTGNLGTANITLASGLTLTQVRDTINAAAAQTGVSAAISAVAAGSLAGASGINLNSTTYGSQAFVSVQVLSGGAINTANGTTDNGAGGADDFQSVARTVGIDANVTVNGQTAGTDGLDVSYSANGLSLSFTLSGDFGSGNTAATSTNFTVKADGGATFQLGTTSGTRQTIGIDSLASYNLGGGNNAQKLSALKSGGSVDLNTDVEGALNSVRSAIGDVASIRGRIGGFQKFQVGSAMNALQAAETGLTEASSAIGDTDFALATAELNRQQILIQSGIQLLGVANQQAAQILSLL